MRMLSLLCLSLLTLAACGDDAAGPRAETPSAGGAASKDIDPGFTDPGEVASALPLRQTPLAVGDPAPPFVGRPKADTVVLVFYRGHW